MSKTGVMFLLVVISFSNAFALSLENAIKDRKIRISPVEINGSPIASFDTSDDKIALVCTMVGARTLLSYKVKDYPLNPEIIANDRFVRLYDGRTGNVVVVELHEWKYSSWSIAQTAPVLDEVVCIK